MDVLLSGRELAVNYDIYCYFWVFYICVGVDSGQRKSIKDFRGLL